TSRGLPLQRLFVRQMNNQWIETRALFRFENFCDCNRIERISCEAVHGFCLERDNLPFAQQFHRALFGGRLAATPQRRRYSFGLHLASLADRTASDCFLRKASNFFRIASSEVARMAAARSAAFFAPASPMASVPTGIPPGICAVDSSGSRPCSFDWMGTPRTRSHAVAAM